MGLTGSKSGLIRAPGFIFSAVGKGERGKNKAQNKKKKKGMKEKGNTKGMEGRKEGRKKE